MRFFACTNTATCYCKRYLSSKGGMKEERKEGRTAGRKESKKERSWKEGDKETRKYLIFFYAGPLRVQSQGSDP